MYQPYPGGAQMPETPRPPAPASVRNAAKVMHAGPVASLIGAALWIFIAWRGSSSAFFTATPP